jgi:hypothetical protein
VELLVVLVLNIVLVSAILAVLEGGQRVQARDSEWAISIQEGRVGLQRMAREIRQAYSVKGATPSSIDFLITFGGQNYEVYYECDVAEPKTGYDECVRLAATVGKALPSLSSGQVYVQHVINNTTGDPSDPVFSYSPDAISPNFVTLKTVLPASGSLPAGTGLKHNIVLSSGAYIRAMNLGA